jgi:hypothetical protein
MWFVRLCFALLVVFLPSMLRAQAAARFDLAGPRVDITVTRNGVTLPITAVPNLQPGDKLWLHPDLPTTQSVHYLLIAAFLRGTTNPPPDEWFTRVETWNRKVREEGANVTVPAGAQQAILFLAPETGGDFSTLRSAVKGRPGVFVRASQDLDAGSFEQARIEKYLDSMKRVPPNDAAALEQHSNFLARTLNLRPNEACFKESLDQQYDCLTRTGTQTLLGDEHGQSIVDALSSGSNVDLIHAASYTSLGGGGLYSAYVGAVVDLVRVLNNLHTAHYQYIPALALPVNQSLNLRLNTPPSFNNPKSVIVIGLPSIQTATLPPLRPADPDHTSCLLDPSLVLPIEGAPLVFSTGFAHDLILHLNSPQTAGKPQNLALEADAYSGGLRLNPTARVRHELPSADSAPQPTSKSKKPAPTTGEPSRIITGTIRGFWGFDSFTGPTVPLEQIPGGDWRILPSAHTPENLIAGKPNQLQLMSSGTACIQSISLEPGSTPVAWKLAPDQADNTPGNIPPVNVTLNLQHSASPGSIRLSIQQFGSPTPDQVGTRTFAEPARIDSLVLHADDDSVALTGTSLDQVQSVKRGDLVYLPVESSRSDDGRTLELKLSATVKPPRLKVGEKFSAQVQLQDGRNIPSETFVLPPRPSITLLSRRITSAPATPIVLGSEQDLPLSAQLLFFLKSKEKFSRAEKIEIASVDGALNTSLSISAGSLILQDQHTVLANFDPLKLFGASTFGPFRLRAVAPDGTPGEWIPLATIVRLPTLTDLRCPASPEGTCMLSGSGLYLIDGVANDPDFADPTRVPEGFVQPALGIPHPHGPNFYLTLRDDSTAINTVTMPAKRFLPGSEPAPSLVSAPPTSPTF